MIAALDTTPLSLSSGGLRRYTEQLISGLRALPDTELVLFPASRKPLWWSFGLPKALAHARAAVFHGTNFEVPYVPVCPTVLTLHDLSPWKNPEWHSGAERVRTRTPVLLRLGLPTMVITPSQAIRREAIAEFRLHPSRVVAVPEAAASHLTPTGKAQGNYFLFVGTVEPRKNVPALIHAWRSLHCSAELIIAGRQREDAPQISPEPGLRILGEVPERDLPDLYSQAIALVYPSHYEGFGLPVLEAMQCGAAVITSNDPAIREVSGGAAIHVDAWELSRAMAAMLNDGAERRRRQKLSVARAAEYSWTRTAQLTRDVYIEAMERWNA